MGRDLIVRYFLFAAIVFSANGHPVFANEMLSSDESRLREILETMLPISKSQVEQTDSDVAMVYHEVLFDAEVRYYTQTKNMLWWVQRGEATDIVNWVHDLKPGTKVESIEAFMMRPGDLTISSAQQAEIQRLDKSRINIQEGNKDSRYTNIALAFDTAQPGDLFGISIRTKIPNQLRWFDWRLAGKYPTARCEVHLKTEFDLAYTIFGNRIVPGAMKQEVLEKKNGHIRDVRVWVDGVDSYVIEPYSPPVYKQSPSITVGWRARLVPSGGTQVWYIYSDWNMIASQMSEYETDIRDKTKKTEELAKSLTDGMSPSQALDRLYHFVRDDMQTVHSQYFSDSNETTVDDITEANSGSVDQKSYVLLVMLEQLGISAEIVWAHDEASGLFSEPHPNWQQFSEPLVRATIDGEETWLDLNCSTCAPGGLQERFMNARIFRYNRGADELDQDLWEQAINDATKKRLSIMSYYLDRVKRMNWYTISRISVSGKDISNAFSETITLSPNDEQGFHGRINLLATGRDKLRTDSATSLSADETGREWVESRFEDVSDLSPVSATSALADTFNVVYEMTMPPIAPPMGDTWILPAEVVFGNPSLAEWPATKRAPYYVPRDNESHWECRIPLPANWASAETPKDKSLGVKCFQYSISYKIEGHELVVRRKRLERAITIESPNGVSLLRNHANTIRQLEMTPVVLKRSGS
ncbi:MAG: hypothetical protein ACI9UQ_000650 [Candidatus Krumholzibacteriia bacterium]|jgi:hypothetical protein